MKIPKSEYERKIEKRQKELRKEYFKHHIKYDSSALLHELYLVPQRIVINGISKLVTPLEIALLKQKEKAMQGDMKAIKFLDEQLKASVDPGSEKLVFIIDTIVPRLRARKARGEPCLFGDKNVD